MKLDMQLMTDVYLHLNHSDYMERDTFIAINREALLNCLPALLETSATLTSPTIATSVMQWSGGDEMDSYKIFTLACEINDALSRIMGGAAEITMYECGIQIADMLDSAANTLRHRGITDGVRHKKQQAYDIRELVAKRYAKYATRKNGVRHSMMLCVNGLAESGHKGMTEAALSGAVATFFGAINSPETYSSPAQGETTVGVTGTELDRGAPRDNVARLYYNVRMVQTV